MLNEVLHPFLRISVTEFTSLNETCFSNHEGALIAQSAPLLLWHLYLQKEVHAMDAIR